MPSPRSIEQEAFVAVSAEADALRPALTDKGVRLGGVEILRHRSPDIYESELRIFVYRHDQICDALELRIWRDGRFAFTIDAVAQWFRTELTKLAEG